jgi:hypothetical protein
MQCLLPGIRRCLRGMTGDVAGHSEDKNSVAPCGTTLC